MALTRLMLEEVSRYKPAQRGQMPFWCDIPGACYGVRWIYLIVGRHMPSNV